MSTDKTEQVALQGKVGEGLYAEVDAVDAHLADMKWCVEVDGSRQYARTKIGRKTVRMHALIMPKRDGYVVDHIDGDGLNNRRSNLRYATNSENQANAKLKQSNKSGVKGLYLKNDRGRILWIAQVRKDTVIHRKCFAFQKKEAAIAWLKEIRERLHGEFARHVSTENSGALA